MPSDPGAAVESFLREHEVKDEPLYDDARYAAAYVDLDQDGEAEAVVHLMGSSLCGTGGCNTFVLKRRGGAYEKVSEFSIGHLPIRVLESRSHGWRDLGIQMSGGGIMEPYEAILSFDGSAYPYNPSIPPARPSPGDEAGQILIARDNLGRPIGPP